MAAIFYFSIFSCGWVHTVGSLLVNYGATFRNAGGDLVIDSDFLNYGLVASGTYTTIAGTSIGGPVISFGSASTSIAPPLIAAKWLANDGLYCWGVKAIGSPGAWTGFQLLLQALPAANVVVSYAVFSANPISASNFGLIVRNSEKVPTFDSEFTPLAISGFLDPQGWVMLSSSIPYVGYRVTTYIRANPIQGAYMVLSTHRFGDLVYPGGVEGRSPVAIASYGYGYGSNGTLRLIVTLDTANSSVTPSALSTPNAYVSALTSVGF